MAKIAAVPSIMGSEGSFKVAPVVSEEEIYRYVDLGLGCGVDGTSRKPWLNKTSFQARHVTFDNIIGRDEGGAMQGYEKEISSFQALQCEITTSIDRPNKPLTIGADSELSRSVNSSRRAIGRQIINRTISFKDDFVDAPHSDETISEKTGGSSDIQNHWNFEQRLAHWIIQRLKASWQQPQSVTTSVSAVKLLPPLTLPTETVKGNCPLTDLLFVIEQHRKPDLQLIIKGCEEFLDYFRVTHYVSAIELGAAEYQVFTEHEYQYSDDVLAKMESYLSGKKHAPSKMMIKRIGTFTSDKVEHGSYGEAVVNIAIKSILTLVKTDFLHEAMSTALLKYFDSQKDKSNGPFLISCDLASGLFLAVDPETHAVKATTEVTQATHFQIIPSNDKYNEFYITYHKEIGRVIQKRRDSIFHSTEPLSTVALYLDAPVSVRGRNNGPLYMSDTVSDESSRFVLHSRIIHNKVSPVSISTWTSGTEMFYINCSRRKRKINGYLAVKRVRERGTNEDTYITACVSSRKYHDSSNVHMLFQLVRSCEKFEEKKDTDTEQ
ncbi:PREDICTED: uncharacterized protein LOC109580917 [Amphimedon queenslandica]|uniref:Uncharacterized protein n=2 Tax=Amphimedon queenslandica TaxID=400682 RepID=A0AAN0IZU6_AMPQE|nr:PREDICTED: uncharacterized protein LOC109580917 [Amphimedon queenslandica]|eukprot:XP_019850062.1 PREDICTED: uncharacterized protein LOC109580917 [Amphimedon queenslandica]